MTEALAGRAPGRRRLTAGLVVLAWVAAVAVAASVAWVVVDRAGISLLGGPGPGLTGGGAAATSTATSTASATAGHTASLSSAGNRVTATCTAGVISLGGAIPASRWQVEVKERSPRLKVEFHSGSRTVEIEGVCRGGVPVLTLGHGAASPTGSTPSSTDDHGGNRPGSGGSSSSSGGGGDDGGGSHGGSGSGGGGGSDSGKSGSGSDG